MKLLFSILCTLIIHFSSAQNDKKVSDSLQYIIRNSTSDTLKVNHSISLALYWSKTKSEDSQKLLKETLKRLDSKSYNFKNKNRKKAEIYDILGVIQRRNSNYDTALYYYLKSLKLKNIERDSIHLGRSYHNIAVLFNQQKNYNKAIQYMRKAMPLRKKFNDSIKYAKSVNLYGYMMYKNNQVDSALYYYNKARHLFKNNIRITDVNRKIAFIYIDNLKYKKALNIFEDNLDIYNKHKLIERKGNGLIELALVYRKLNRPNKAEEILIEALKIAKQTGDKKLRYKIYNSKYHLALNKKDYHSALKYYKAYKTTKDSVYNIKKTEKIKELELVYIHEKEKLKDSLGYALREQKLVTLSKTHKKQRTLYTILFIISLLGFISVILLYKYKRKLDKAFITKEQLRFELLNSKLENISNYAEQLEVDNKMRFQFKEELLNKIKTIKKNHSTNDLETYQSLIIDLQTQINTEKRLDVINESKNTTNIKLERILINRFSNLTKSEREICILISLNLSNKEIMNIRNSSSDSIKSARYRIRKKMNIPKGDELEKFIKNLK